MTYRIRRDITVLDTADTFALPAEPVTVAGDWHGNVRATVGTLPEIDTKTVLHVGDFGLYPDSDLQNLLEVLDEAEHIGRVLVTPGNHEDWVSLTELFAEHPGKALRISGKVWVLPRGFRFTLGERSVVSLGGAPSIDFEWRVSGDPHWSELEALTDADVDAAIAGGPADIMIAHDGVDGSGVLEIEHILAHPVGWSARALDYAREGRERLTRAWNGIKPLLLLHGHYHVRGSGVGADGRRVEALHQEGRRGNLVTLDPATLTVIDL